MKKSIKNLVSFLCCICMLIGCLPMKTFATDGSASEVIISCNASSVTHTIGSGTSWKTTTNTSVVYPGETQSYSTSYANNSAIYDLSSYVGTYDLYAYNLKTSTTQTNVKVSISQAGYNVVTGSWDQANTDDHTWVALGTYTLDANSYVSFTNTTALVMRDAAIRLVPNNSGTPITPAITMNEGSEIIITSDKASRSDTGWSKTENNVVAGPTGKYAYTTSTADANVTYTLGSFAGKYELLVYSRCNKASSHQTSVSVTVAHTDGSTNPSYDQAGSPDATWVTLGTYTFGEDSSVTFTNSSEKTMRDTAIKLIPVTDGTGGSGEGDDSGEQGNTAQGTIIPCNDDSVTYVTAGSWKEDSEVVGPTGVKTKWVNNIEKQQQDYDAKLSAIYNLSEFADEKAYDLYVYNSNSGVTETNAEVSISCKGHHVVTGYYDPTAKTDGTWIALGTYEFDSTSYVSFTTTDEKVMRTAAIKLVPNNGTPLESELTVNTNVTEYIITSDVAKHEGGKWSTTDNRYVTGPTGKASYNTSVANAYVTYDLTDFTGTYDLYVYNRTLSTAQTKVAVTIIEAEDKEITGYYDQTVKADSAWVALGTYTLDDTSTLTFTNTSTSRMRDMGVKLVQNTSGTSITPDITIDTDDSGNTGDGGNTGDSTSEVIITCNDARVRHTGSWRDVAVGTVVGPTGDKTKRTSSVYSRAVYDLSGFSGTYDIYYYNLNHASTNTEAKVSLTKADGEEVQGIFDPTQKADATWISMGTYELGAKSAFVLTNVGSNAKNQRDAAIKLVPNTSGTAITADVTLAPYTPTWRTIDENNPLIYLSAIDDGVTMSYGWKTSSIPYPTGKGFYTNTAGEWAKFMPYLNEAEGITLWYFVDGNANNAEDPALQVEIYAEGQLTTKTIDFASGETRWEELGTFYFDGNGTEYIKFTRQENKAEITSRLTNLRIGYKSAVNDEKEEEIYSVYKDTDKEILQRIGLLTGTADGITEEYIQSTVTQTDLEVIRLKMNGQLEEAENYVGSSNPASATDYAKMLLEQMGYVYGTDFDMTNIIAVAAEAGITVEAEGTFTIDDLAEMTVQALEADMKGEKRSLLGSVMDKMEPISEEKYTNPSVFTDAMREARETAKNRDRTLIYNNDGNDTYVSYANYPGPFDTSTVTEPMTHANFLSKRITELETSQVDSVFYVTGVYNSYHHNSAIADLRQRDWTPELFKTGDNGDTRDSIQTVLDWCEANNREFMWSMRMNDTHDKDYEVQYLDSFKQAHPDWLVSSRETCAIDLQLGALWSALDYAEPGVRQRSYDLLREVILNYDVDGIELDFSRHSVYFAQVVCNAEDAHPENIERMNNFMRNLRTLTEQVSAEKGEPILIAIHVADSMDYCKAIGLDVEQWMEEDLVDVVSIRTYGAFQSMEDGLAEYEDYDVPVYLIMDANNRGTDNYNYSKEAAMAYKAGYTGIQIYNVFKNVAYDSWRELCWTVGDPSTVTYDENYTEQSRVSTDSAYAIDAVARFVTYGKEKQSISFAESSVSKVYGEEDFTVTVSGVAEGSTVTYSSSNTKVATVDAATGKVTICGAGEAVITAKASGTKTHAYATATYTLTVEEAPPAPSPTPLEILTDGTDTSYKKESGDETTIHCNGAMSEFEGLKMDGTEVDKSNYGVKEGSTIITLKAEYLNSLSVGEHTVTLEYSNNRSIDTKLTILEADTAKPEDTDEEDEFDSVDDDAVENTQNVSGNITAGSATPTGDNSNIGLWVLLLAAAMIVCGTVLILNKKREV